MAIAKAIFRAVRHSSGGLYYVLEFEPGIVGSSPIDGSSYEAPILA